MRPFALLLVMIVASVAACSGRAEDAAHREANAVDAAGEREADALERQGANRQADAVENAADGRSDAMHRQVDKDH